jgi:hypothetical protein
VAKASAARVVGAAARSTPAAPVVAGAVARGARELWSAAANPDAPGLLRHGQRFEASDALVLDALLRLNRLAVRVADTLREHPDPAVRRSAAVLAARAHPLLAAHDA